MAVGNLGGLAGRIAKSALELRRELDTLREQQARIANPGAGAARPAAGNQGLPAQSRIASASAPAARVGLGRLSAVMSAAQRPAANGPRPLFAPLGQPHPASLMPGGGRGPLAARGPSGMGAGPLQTPRPLSAASGSGTTGKPLVGATLNRPDIFGSSNAHGFQAVSKEWEPPSGKSPHPGASSVPKVRPPRRRPTNVGLATAPADEMAGETAAPAEQQEEVVDLSTFDGPAMASQTSLGSTLFEARAPTTAARTVTAFPYVDVGGAEMKFVAESDDEEDDSPQGSPGAAISTASPMASRVTTPASSVAASSIAASSSRTTRPAAPSASSVSFESGPDRKADAEKVPKAKIFDKLGLGLDFHLPDSVPRHERALHLLRYDKLPSGFTQVTAEQLEDVADNLFIAELDLDPTRTGNDPVAAAALKEIQEAFGAFRAFAEAHAST